MTRSEIQRHANEIDFELFRASEKMRWVAHQQKSRDRAKLMTGVLEINTARRRIRAYMHAEDVAGTS